MRWVKGGLNESTSSRHSRRRGCCYRRGCRCGGPHIKQQVGRARIPWARCKFVLKFAHWDHAYGLVVALKPGASLVTRRLLDATALIAPAALLLFSSLHWILIFVHVGLVAETAKEIRDLTVVGTLMTIVMSIGRMMILLLLNISE